MESLSKHISRPKTASAANQRVTFNEGAITEENAEIIINSQYLRLVIHIFQLYK